MCHSWLEVNQEAKLSCHEVLSSPTSYVFSFVFNRNGSKQLICLKKSTSISPTMSLGYTAGRQIQLLTMKKC